MSTIDQATNDSTAMFTIDYDLLYSYCRDSDFPPHNLQSNGVSDNGIDFVRSLMVTDLRN